MIIKLAAHFPGGLSNIIFDFRANKPLDGNKA